MEHLQVKYRNNQLEAEHGKQKCLINPVGGLQSMKAGYATIKGFAIMRMFKDVVQDQFKVNLRQKKSG